ncbi:TonB-dependent receptor [Novosphingobium mathurense]|uniref:Iron complex outermembrane recepter protein n=1 Tax=Novosphingobium mathurense TaxID=428990 RepID=A0A1U6ILQ9_9SPHN|nr:TonB-dependent receptor [Novosphingobium mathurense]SLK08946.1 iron complex outermembrane recepter protein [Novosphingobium mathurense]
MKRALFIATVAYAALAASKVQAQDAGQTAQAAEEHPEGIGEIIVTAQRKEQSLQKTGVAIDAVSANALVSQGVTNAADLTRAVPAISITNGGGQVTSIFLRGVGNITNNAYFDAAISPNYDGVVLGRPTGAFSSAFYDIARVEVLKGPQGILYGRNATGGAINIIPNRPKLADRAMGFSLAYGNYDAIDVQGYLNLPVTENSALRLAAVRQKHDGYNRDGSDDQDRWGVRGQFLIEPTDNLSLRVAGDYTKVEGVGAGGSYTGKLSGIVLTPATFDEYEGLNTAAANTYRQTQLAAPGFGFLQPMKQQQSIDYTYWGVHAEAKLTTGIGEFTLIPAYRNTKGGSVFYGPAFAGALNNEEYGQFSTELRLAGKTGMLDYVLGGFYFDEKIQGNNSFNQEFVLPLQDYKANTTSWAAFGQLTANLTDRFRLIGGLRYTDDKKTMDGNQAAFVVLCGAADGIPNTPGTTPSSFAVGCAGAPGGRTNLPHFPSLLQPQDAYNFLVSNGYISGTTPYAAGTQVYPVIGYTAPPGQGSVVRKTELAVNDSRSFNRVTWRAAAEFDVTPQNLLYASVETGYRAGGLQIGGSRPDYNPEYITAYTVGSKNRFFDNRLQVNLEAFYWKYRDQQITYFSFSPNSGTVSNTNENVGRSTIKGFDIDVVAKPTRTTTVSAKVQYLDTRYQGLILQTLAPRDNFNCPRTVTSNNTPTGPVIQFDCSGRPLLQSPKWTLNLGAEQIVHLGGNLELVGTVNTAWRDNAWTNFNYLDFMQVPAYWSTSATVALRDNDGSWSLSAYVTNIENNRHLFQGQASPLGFAINNYTAPRTYGLRLSADF